MSKDQEMMNKNLEDFDPELTDLMKKERQRQHCNLEMIASENFTSLSVTQCLGSSLTNKYSEGYPGQRYYGGNQFIDQIELLAQKRALEAFKLDPEKWGVNVQPYSGSPANFAVYTALVGPHGRIMGLDLPDGGHLTHGFRTKTKNVSATSLFFESMPYKVIPGLGFIDYNNLAVTAKLFLPDLIIAGMSCYPRKIHYYKFREIADQVNAILFADISHVSGLMIADIMTPPFEHCDIVTTTTHKTLRGPRAGVIFYRKGVKSVSPSGEKIYYDFEERINSAVFPGLQGGPHNHQIAGIAVAMKQAMTPEFHDYQKQVYRNAQVLCEGLKKHGFEMATDGTDCHLILVELDHYRLSGKRAECILEEISIACNKNAAPNDTSALNPSGLRFGTPALTTRGLKEDDIKVVVEFIYKGLALGKKIDRACGPKMTDFKNAIAKEYKAEIEQLKQEVEKFASKFPLPGNKIY